jgi:hypothetical protein
MKKIILVLAIVLTIGVLGFLMFACGGYTPLSGTAWADTESFTYQMSGEGVEGTLVKTLTRIEANQNTRIREIDRDFNIRGAVLTREVNAVINGQTVHQFSETIMHNFRSIASYEERTVDNVTVFATAWADGNRYYYSQNGGAAQWVSGAFADNAILYYMLRVYSAINTGHSITARVFSPITGEAQTLSLVSQGRVALEKRLDVIDSSPSDNPLNNNKQGEDAEVVPRSFTSAIRVRINKTTPPIGTGIEVFYSTNEAHNRWQGSFVSPHPPNISEHVPLIIIENDIVYTLIEGKVF